MTVNKSGPAVAGTVQYLTIDGTATAPSDYTAIAATTLSFSAAQTSRTFTVFITNSATPEPQENFSLRLQNPSVGTVGADALVTINDDDGSGSIQFASSTYTTTEQTGTASLSVTRTGGTTGSASILCSTVAGVRPRPGLELGPITPPSRTRS